ncbi:hypothetical protein H5410_012410 [Solanum commersonii]|uniref:Uncharacterized protein n=1 Tax=Solanum commersonii TaxID=4109 RepID=A0A9J6ARE5_SOLCO|nr:hypothetical protein H5410_012410 [Solanum commersonii]
MEKVPLLRNIQKSVTDEDNRRLNDFHGNSLDVLMTTLRDYKKQSGQIINKEKKAKNGFIRGKFPLMYLGCPIGHAKKKKVHFAKLMKKVHNKLQARKGTMLSFGGKVMLIHNVLNNIPIYLLSAINPLRCVIHDLHRVFAKKNWKFREDGINKHWVAWSDLCRPKHEGGVGFRSLFDISKDLFAKLWWVFRTRKTLWSNFMWNKYCKKERPQVVEWKNGSLTWKYMLEWEPKCGHSSIWYDNWSQLGALHYIVPLDSARNVQLDEVKQCFLNGEWNYDLLQTDFGDDISRHVIQLLRSSEDEQQWDKPWWMLKTSGKFTVGSAWDFLREKQEVCLKYKYI